MCSEIHWNHMAVQNFADQLRYERQLARNLLNQLHFAQLHAETEQITVYAQVICEIEEVEKSLIAMIEVITCAEESFTDAFIRLERSLQEIRLPTSLNDTGR